MKERQDISLNKMGTQPIKKLTLTMGIPIILSMVLQAFYNIVDSYFVSKIPDTAAISHMGDYAMNALTLAFPVQMLMIAVGVGTGVGINALLSQSLGANDLERASKISGNAIFLGLCSYIVFLLFGIFGIHFYFISQTNDTIIVNMGMEYLQICTNFSFGAILFMIYEKLLQATGRTILSTIGQVAGALTNIVLDPIMIFGLCGCPKMGIAGAAYATVIGQCVSFVLCFVFHFVCNREIDNRLKYLKPNGKIIGDIYKIGVPAIIMQALMSFMTYGVNIIFGAVSQSLVTAYGIYYKIQQFAFFAAFGLNNAQIPIVAFNYGMGSAKRIKEGIRYGLIDIVVIMAICALGFSVFARPITDLFSLSAETTNLCVKAMHIVTLGYLFVGANISFQGIFQALGKGVHSLIVSLIRLLVVTLPLAWLFTKCANAESLVWFAFPIAETCALIMAIFFLKNLYESQIKPLETAYEK